MSTNEQVIFLLRCIESNGIKIDFTAVAKATGLKPATARMRYTRLKASMSKYPDDVQPRIPARITRANPSSCTVKVIACQKRSMSFESCNESDANTASKGDNKTRGPPRKRQASEEHVSLLTPKDPPISSGEPAQDESTDNESGISSAGEQLREGIREDLDHKANRAAMLLSNYMEMQPHLSANIYPARGALTVVPWTQLLRKPSDESKCSISTPTMIVPSPIIPQQMGDDNISNEVIRPQDSMSVVAYAEYIEGVREQKRQEKAAAVVAARNGYINRLTSWFR